MTDVVFLNDHRDVIRTCGETDVGIVCEFCGHEFKPGERYVSDAETVSVCPAAAGGLSDETCPNPKTDPQDDMTEIGFKRLIDAPADILGQPLVLLHLSGATEREILLTLDDAKTALLRGWTRYRLDKQKSPPT